MRRVVAAVHAYRAWVTAVCATAILCIPIGWVLNVRVPAIVEQPITAERGWQPYPVDIPGAMYVTTDGAYAVHRARLRLDDPIQLTSHAQVRLLVATHSTDVALINGELRVDGTPCVYRTLRGAVFPNNDLLTFIRGKGCAPLHGEPSGELVLIVRAAALARPTLWTWVWTDVAGERTSVRIDDRNIPATGAGPVLRGVFADEFRQRTALRLELARFVWIRDGAGGAITWLLVGAALAMFAGVFLWLRVGGRARSIVAGTFCVTAGLGMAYAAAVPPMQAPDEADHLLSYGALTGDPGFQDRVRDWGRKTHFLRIRFHPDQRFRPNHTDAPFAGPWASEVAAEPVASTSPATALWWKGLRWPIGHGDPSTVLLAVRLANVLMFAAAAAAAAAILVGAGAGKRAVPIMAALLAVPTLPFFAMHMSDTAPLTSAYLLLAALSAAVLLDGRLTHRLGLPIGIAAALALATDRSSMPMAALLGALLFGRAVLGTRENDGAGALRASVIFWGGLATGLALFTLLPGEAYFEELNRTGRWWMPPAFKHLVETPLAHPVVALLVLSVAGLALETLCRVLRQWSRPRRVSGVWALRAAGLVVAVAVAASVIASTVVTLPTVPHLVQYSTVTDSVGLKGYVRAVVIAIASTWRVSGHDFLTSTTFWGGFGWVDTLMPPWFVSVAVLLQAAGLVLLAALLIAERDRRRLLWLAIIAAATLLCAAAYAAAAYFMGRRNLHGRYLIGLYLAIQAVAWTVPALAAARQTWSRRLRPLPILLILLGAAGHAFAICSILRRYY